MSILLVVAAFAGPHGFAAPDDTLAAFLNGLPKIRIVVSDGPNLGHESAAATVYTRLRQLGYAGEIEVLYNDEYSSELEKLVRLFPPLNGPGRLNFPELKLRFVPRSNAKAEEAVLGIVGATDQKHIPLQNVGVGVLLTLQPLQWHSDFSFNKLEYRVQSQSGSKVDSYFSRFKELGYVFDLPNPTDPLKFIHDNMDYTAALGAKSEGLVKILSGARELMPVYGHSISEIWQLRRVYEGVVEAVHEKPALFRGGVVIPVFNEFGTYRMSLLEEEAEVGKIRLAHITDDDLGRRIEELKAKEVLIVQVGRVSKPVFEYLFSRATVAPVIEGKNSANLMQLTGKPYLPSAKKEPYIFTKENMSVLSGGEDEGYKNIALPALNAMTDQEAPKDIAQFLIEAKMPESGLSRLFKRYSVSPADLAKDKLYQGLLLARERVSQRLCDMNLK